MSSNGFSPLVWGKYVWFILHMISFNYPLHPTLEDKQNYYNFVMSLRFVLPCGACRKNFSKKLLKHPLTMKSLKNRRNFSKWMFSIHNLVNRDLKKTATPTFKNVEKRYESLRAK